MEESLGGDNDDRRDQSVWGEIWSEVRDDLVDALGLIPFGDLNRAARLLLQAHASTSNVYVIANGGSAATASHLVCDLSKTARVPGTSPIRAFALTDNAPLLTAWANDVKYAEVFRQQLDGLVQAGDVVVAITGSGRSPNVIAGLQEATRRGAATIALVGCDGGRAVELVDVAIHVPSQNFAVIETVHMAVVHALASMVRSALLEEVSARADSVEVGGRWPDADGGRTLGPKGA